MSKAHHRRQRFKLRSFYVWHRYMGITAALFMVLVAGTGVLLNHTEQLQLDHRHVQSAWVLDWYGIKAPDDMTSFDSGERRVTLMGEHLYLDEQEIDGEFRRLAGAADIDGTVVIAVDDRLLLLSRQGELVDAMDAADGIPAGVQDVGKDGGGRLVLKTALDAYTTDADFLRWGRWKGDAATVAWSHPQPTDPALKRTLQYQYLGEILPVERVLLDLHSGRFFGRFGPWVIDLSAALMVMLSLSGAWMWFRRRR